MPSEYDTQTRVFEKLQKMHLANVKAFYDAYCIDALYLNIFDVFIN